MFEFMCSVFWAFVCYVYSRDTVERYPDINMNPLNYIIGGFLFGIFSWLVALYKKKQYQKRHFGRY